MRANAKSYSSRVPQYGVRLGSDVDGKGPHAMKHRALKFQTQHATSRDASCRRSCRFSADSCCRSCLAAARAGCWVCPAAADRTPAGYREAEAAYLAFYLRFACSD